MEGMAKVSEMFHLERKIRKAKEHTKYADVSEKEVVKNVIKDERGMLSDEDVKTVVNKIEGGLK